MNDTRFNTHSRNWAGDMTIWLRESADDNHEQIARMRRNLRYARTQELTPRQRQMMELYYDRGMSVTETAAALGVNPSTVSRTLRRAQERLMRCLQYSL